MSCGFVIEGFSVCVRMCWKWAKRANAKPPTQNLVTQIPLYGIIIKTQGYSYPTAHRWSFIPKNQVQDAWKVILSMYLFINSLTEWIDVLCGFKLSHRKSKQWCKEGRIETYQYFWYWCCIERNGLHKKKISILCVFEY